MNRDDRDDLDPRRSECSINGGGIRFRASVKAYECWLMEFVLTIFDTETQKEKLHLRVKFRDNPTGMIDRGGG